MKQLVIGLGEVGKALFEVLEGAVCGIDKDDVYQDVRFDVIHVCIPYSPKFHQTVKDYVHDYLAPDGLVIIHSTVPVGESRSHGAVHSPIRGVHPRLAQGIRTFVKFFGGSRAGEAAEIFQRLGIECRTTSKSETTEALKLWDTTYYGWCIVFEKAVKAYCEKHALDFDVVYRQANLTYNNGYAWLGRCDVWRPVLNHVDGPIGGHCVIPNARLLGGSIANMVLFLGGGIANWDVLGNQAAALNEAA